MALSIPLSKTGITVSYISLILFFIIFSFLNSSFRQKLFGFLSSTPLIKAILPLLIVCLLSIFYSSDLSEAWGRTSNILNLFLISLIISFIVEKCNMKSYHLLLFFIVSLLALSIIGYLQVFLFNSMPLKPFRPLGMHHIWFANLLSMGIYISFVLILNLKRLSLPWFIATLLLLFIFLAFCSIIFSTCRGAWLALLATSFSSFFLFLRRKKIALVISLVFILFLSVAIYNSSQTIRIRISQAINDIEQYRKGHVSTSIGSRFLMWKASWKIFKESPLFGVGIGDYNLAIKNLVKEKEIPDFISRYNQPHSVYFFLLATTGIIGLFSFLWMFFYIIIVSLHQIIYRKKFHLSWICFLITVHLLIASFFDTLFFIYTIACAYGFILGCTFKKEKDDFNLMPNFFFTNKMRGMETRKDLLPALKSGLLWDILF
ncbi:O-antigen ligase family protein [Thermodesulfatator atlanticus]